MWTLGLCVLAAVFSTTLSLGTKCMTDAECAAGECCFRHTGPLIVSKRQDLPLLSHSIDSVTGYCEKYKNEGDYCSYFEKLNGHCGCGPGLNCQFVAAPTLTVDSVVLQPAVSKRSVYMPGPGTIQCVRNTTHS